MATTTEQAALAPIEQRHLSLVELSKNVAATLRSKLGRLTAASLLAVTANIAGSGVESNSAGSSEATEAANITYTNLGYPWAQAPCEFGKKGGPSCVNPIDKDDKYDWGVYDKYGTFHEFQTDGSEYRNCTGYVAWKLGSLGLSATKLNNLGDAKYWYKNSPAKEHNLIPKAGEIAVDTKGRFGHIAYIELVNSKNPKNPSLDNITVSEYNYDTKGHGDRRTGTAAALGFTKYVNFGLKPKQTTKKPITKGAPNIGQAPSPIKPEATPIPSELDPNTDYSMHRLKTRFQMSPFDDDITLYVGNTFYEHDEDNIVNKLGVLTYNFGEPGDEIYSGHFNKGGNDSLATRRGSTFYFNGGGISSQIERSFNFGEPGDQVYVGNYDGISPDDLILRRGNTFYIDTGDDGGQAEVSFNYGEPTDKVLIGDVNGDNEADIILRRGSTFYINTDHTHPGITNYTETFGPANGEPLIGDFDGDEKDDLAVVGNGYFYARMSHDGSLFSLKLTEPAGIAYSGDIDGSGADDLLIKEGSTYYEYLFFAYYYHDNYIGLVRKFYPANGTLLSD